MEIKSFDVVIINPGCKSHCRFCGPCSRPTPEELLEQERRVAKNLEEFRREGSERVEISGSDPIEYENIVPLIRYMKGRSGTDRSFEFVQLATHGRKLYDKRFLGELIDSGLDCLRVPIYGSSPEIHDYVTGAEGSFAETVGGLRMARRLAPEIRILLHTLIMKQNKDDLIEIAKLAKELGAESVSISIPCLAVKEYSYYLPIKELAPFARMLYSHIKENKLRMHFTDIPFCVFGEYKLEYMVNEDNVANLGSNCQPPKRFESGIKNMPNYRLKMKVGMCQECKCNSFCKGFYKNDVEEFGTGDLRPIK